MKKISRNILKYVGYSAFSLFTFLLFFYITFPMQAVQNRLDAEIAKASQGKITVKAKKLQLAGISGLRLKEINIFIENDNNEPPSRVTMDELEAKIYLFGTIKNLISGDNSGLLGPLAGADIYFKQGEGSALVNLQQDNNSTLVSANIEQLRLERLLPLFTNPSIPVRSRLSGKLEATLKKQWYSNGSGKLSLNLRNTSIGEGTVSTPLGPFDLPLVDLGSLSMDLILEKSALKIENWKQSGADLESSTIAGKITLQKKLEASALDVKIAFKPSADFLEKNAKFSAMLQMAGLKKDSKDHYTLSLGGRLSAPKAKGLSILGK